MKYFKLSERLDLISSFACLNYVIRAGLPHTLTRKSQVNNPDLYLAILLPLTMASALIAMFFAFVAAEFQRQHQQGENQHDDSADQPEIDQHRLISFCVPSASSRSIPS